MAALVLTGTVLCLLALDLALVVTGQATCKGIRCVAGASSCNAAKRCQCDTGLAGDGRTICVASRCVCSSVADPHITLYDSAANPAVTTNLQCTFQMTSYNDFPNNCAASIVHMTTEGRGTGNEANFRVFASGLTAVTFSFGNGPQSTTISAVTPGTPNADGFINITTVDCGLEMGYNDTYGSVYISIPTTVAFSTVGSGVCGNCDSAGEENPGSTPQSHLSYMLQRLSPSDSQQATPYKAQCDSLRTAATSCSATNIVTAGEVCYHWISKDFGLCLLNNNNVASYTALMDSFVSCVQNVCSGAATATACTALVTADTTSTTCALSSRPAACP